jgi:hypothetical protein
MRRHFPLIIVLAGLLTSAIGCRWNASFDDPNGLLVDLRTDHAPGELLIEVVAGPTQPVARPGETDTAPLVGATVEIRAEAGDAVRTSVSGADGRITLRLPSGSYVLTALPINGQRLPAPPASEHVIVPAAGVARAQLEYDTGIR